MHPEPLPHHAHALPHSLPLPASASASTAGMAAVIAPAPAPVPVLAPVGRAQPLLSFTQGVLIGQASMIILAALFLKYVVFEDPEAAKRAREERRRLRAEAEEEGEEDGAVKEDVAGLRRRRGGREGKGRGRGTKGAGGKGKGSASRTPPDFPSATLNAATLLSSISYDLSTHAPESLDWLNVLSAQLISSYRALAFSHASGGARALVEEALNRRAGGTEEGAEAAQGVVGLDFLEVDEVELGDGFPALSDARVRPSGVGGESVRVELDLDYVDNVVLSVSTRVVLNFPRPRFAVLPVSLSVTLERFSGTLTVELPPPLPPPPPTASPSANNHHHQHAHPTVHLSLHPDFELQLTTSSLLGSRAKLQDVPKIEQLLVARIRAMIQDRVVWPGRVEVALPGLSRHHHHSHAHAHGEGLGAEGATGSPPADDLAATLPRTSPLSPLSDTTSQTDPLSPSTPPSLPSPARPKPRSSNPLLARTTSSFSSASGTGTSTGTGSGTSTPSVDLSAPEGPSIALHPRVRPQPAPPAPAPAPAHPSPSPSESLPGYFPPLLPGGGAGVGTKGLAGRVQGGMRYRPAGAAGGVGLGAGR